MSRQEFLRFAIILAAFNCAAASANPVVPMPVVPMGPRIYIASEKLTAKIGPKEAEFDGVFTFKTSGHIAYLDEKVSIRLPIWFPIEFEERQAGVEPFWDTFCREAHDLNNSKEKDALERVLVLKASVGKEQLSPTHLLISPTNSSQLIRSEWAQRGCRVFLFWFPVRPSLIETGTPVRISYRQPLVRSGAEGSFFYLPMFENLPRGISTADTNRYSITLSADPDCVVVGSNGRASFEVKPGGSATLSLQHLQAIRATVKPFRRSARVHSNDFFGVFDPRH
jgi:hypothetical protein